MNVIAQGQADLNTLCLSKILSTMISNHKYLCRTFGYYTKGKVHRKKSKKKLTSVSFAFTHTYTIEKLTLLLFFPKRTWKILKNVQNAKEKKHFISLQPKNS